MLRTSAVIRVGPAGWSYKDWEGPVYPSPVPRGFDRLGWIVDHFDTVEVNSTFYRTPSVSAARSWAERIGGNPRFEMTLKLQKELTHEKSWNADEGKRFRAFLGPLEESGRLGAILAQFPWSFRYSADARERLERIREALDGLPLVVEVRHDSFDTEEFRELLRERSIGLANIDQPPHDHALEPAAHVTSGVAYIRLHGRNREKWFDHEEAWERYDYLYSKDELDDWVGKARSLEAEKVFVVTNNHFRGQSVANALEIRKSLGEEIVIPQTVAEYYPDRFEARLRAEDERGQMLFRFR